MFSTGWFRRVACLALMSASATAAAAQSAPAATLYRVFLRDGSTLVSYGEFARVGDRLVLSLPLGGSAASPDLQLLSLPADAVDWDKTDAYADSARATHYADTRGPNDYALLTEAVSRALGDIALVADPPRKIAMATEARQNVMTWLSEHFGYRASDVARLAGLFDSVIAETRAAGGTPNYDLTLVGGIAEPPSVPLLPAPTQEERVESALRAATLAPDATERTSLLRSIRQVLASVDPHASWAAPLRRRVAASLAAEEKTDRAYAALVRGTLRQAQRYARAANVSGVERMVRRAMRNDDRLGQRRPNEMASALAALDAQLDAARRLRLARDAYAARASVLRAYERAIAPSLATLRTSRGSLDQIRRLAGPSRLRLARLSTDAARALTRLSAAVVPPEAGAAHDLLRNAITLASRAVDGRLQAIASGSMQQAWEASSAAAGALLLLDRAADALRDLNPYRTRAAS
jgi:hypothetical protein